MREESLSREVRYGKQDIAELENASIQVHLIYKKAAELFVRNTYSQSVRNQDSDKHRLDRSKGSGLAPIVLQKWIQTSKGWKCIGCELRHNEDHMMPLHADVFLGGSSSTANGEGHVFKPEMLIQAIVWAQYEKIRMFAPWLGDETFYTADELDTIARYIVPTYFSERPLNEQGKLFKVHRPYGQIPLYQEYVTAPSLCVQLDGEMLEGRLLTGVYVSGEQFSGLNPYLKDGDGGRTYMQACVQ